jgi:hypothetical protein
MANEIITADDLKQLATHLKKYAKGWINDLIQRVSARSDVDKKRVQELNYLRVWNLFSSKVNDSYWLPRLYDEGLNYLEELRDTYDQLASKREKVLASKQEKGVLKSNKKKGRAIRA